MKSSILELAIDDNRVKEDPFQNRNNKFLFLENVLRAKLFQTVVLSYVFFTLFKPFIKTTIEVKQTYKLRLTKFKFFLFFF